MKLRKRLVTKENIEFWENAEKATKKVKSWPKWKRNIQLTKYSSEERVNNDR